MEKQYVEFRDQGYWVAGTRISLDSVVLAFQGGLSPETIAIECFPTLTLEQVYGAITYYLSHKAAVDEYLRQVEVETEKLREALRATEPQYYQRMAEARRQMGIVQQ